MIKHFQYDTHTHVHHINLVLKVHFLQQGALIHINNLTRLTLLSLRIPFIFTLRKVFCGDRGKEPCRTLDKKTETKVAKHKISHTSR